MNLVGHEEIAGSLASLFSKADLYEPEVIHHFSDGICVRELHLKAGSLAVGAIHKTNHITMLVEGTMQIKVGKVSRLVKAPASFESPKGSRKIAFAYTDCVISNIIPTDLKDIEEIEKMFTTLHTDKKELACQQQ